MLSSTCAEKGSFSTFRSGGRRCQVPAWRGDVVREAGACFQQGNTSLANTPSGTPSIDRLIVHHVLVFYFFTLTRLAWLVFVVAGRIGRGNITTVRNQRHWFEADREIFQDIYNCAVQREQQAKMEQLYNRPKAKQLGKSSMAPHREDFVSQ